MGSLLLVLTAGVFGSIIYALFVKAAVELRKCTEGNG